MGQFWNARASRANAMMERTAKGRILSWRKLELDPDLYGLRRRQMPLNHRRFKASNTQMEQN
jgi:hypothetical protein